MSALIMAEAALGSYVPVELAPGVRQMLTAFLRESSSNPLDQIDQAIARRRTDRNLTGKEISRLDDAGALVTDTWHLAGRPG